MAKQVSKKSGAKKQVVGGHVFNDDIPTTLVKGYVFDKDMKSKKAESTPKTTPTTHHPIHKLPDNPKSPLSIWKFIKSSLTSRSLDPSDLLPENYDPQIKPVNCTDFSTLIDCLRERLFVHESMEYTFATMLAAHLGTFLSLIHI